MWNQLQWRWTRESSCGLVLSGFKDPSHLIGYSSLDAAYEAAREVEKSQRWRFVGPLYLQAKGLPFLLYTTMRSYPMGT